MLELRTPCILKLDPFYTRVPREMETKVDRAGARLIAINAPWGQEYKSNEWEA